MTGPVTVRSGGSPLILSFPHAGTEIPPDIERHLDDGDLARRDTDWWIDRLYEPLVEKFDATTVRTSVSRTVIDVNRDPSGTSLYPGQNTTGLCPRTTFDGDALYCPGCEPGDDEIAERRARFFDPYHAALAEAVDTVRNRHGWCLLYDCHSIRSHVPRLFDGELPVFNIGTNEGAACAPAIRNAVIASAEASPFSSVADGRFKGGWITRHYGRPGDRVHAIQMELVQSAYLTSEAPPWAFNEAKAGHLRTWLANILQAACEAADRAEEGG